MASYLIQRPIKHQGRIIKSGQVELEESVAAPLVKSGAIELAVATDESKNDSDTGVKSSSGQAQTDEDIKLDKIVESIGKLDLNDERVMTKGGKPEVLILAEMIGEDVSAQERDVAWKEFRTNQSGAE